MESGRKHRRTLRLDGAGTISRMAFECLSWVLISRRFQQASGPAHVAEISLETVAR